MTTSSKSVRWQLALLAIIFLAPIILATIFYAKRDTWDLATVESGRLLDPPLQMEDMTITKAVGGEAVNEQLKGHWLMMYVAPTVCKADCDRNLYNMRQVELALGKEMDRVTRIVVDISPPMGVHLKTLLREVYKNMPVYFATPYPKDLREGYLYVVDPIGNIILEYSPESKPKDLLSDMERLLKASKIG